MWQSQDFKFFLFFPSSSKQRAATNTEVFLQPGTRTVDLSPGFWIEEMPQSHSLLLALSLISFYSISNHCSKTAGTRLPVSLRYRLNNKNRLALKRCCSKRSRRKSSHSGGGKKSFYFKRISDLSLSFHLRSPNSSCLWDFETMLSASHNCSFGELFHPECP